MAIIRNPRLSDLLLLIGFLALPLSLGELVTPALADFLGKYDIIHKIQKEIDFNFLLFKKFLKG